MSDYGFSERRNKGRDKMREKKKHPYKSGGKNRVVKFDKEISNASVEAKHCPHCKDKVMILLKSGGTEVFKCDNCKFQVKK